MFKNERTVAIVGKFLRVKLCKTTTNIIVWHIEPVGLVGLNNYCFSTEYYQVFPLHLTDTIMYIIWDLKTSNYKTEQKIGRLAKMHFFW